MRSRFRGILAAALCIVALNGCGSDANEPTEKASTARTTPLVTPTQTASGSEGAELADTYMVLKLADCDRFGIGTQVNAATALGYVPENFELDVSGGKAVFALQILSCNDLETDGVSHGPGHFATAWVRIVGPDTAFELPPEAGLEAQSTDAFYPVLFDTDNEQFHAAAKAFGIPITLAEPMLFGPSNEGTQTGELVDNEYEPSVDLHWTVNNVSRIPGGSIGLHVLMGHSTTGGTLIYYGEFAHASGWSGNAGTVEFSEGSALAELAGDTLTGSANGDPVTVTMVVFPDPR